MDFTSHKIIVGVKFNGVPKLTFLFVFNQSKIVLIDLKKYKKIGVCKGNVTMATYTPQLNLVVRSPFTP